MVVLIEGLLHYITLVEMTLLIDRGGGVLAAGNTSRLGDDGSALSSRQGRGPRFEI